MCPSSQGRSGTDTHVIHLTDLGGFWSLRESRVSPTQCLGFTVSVPPASPLRGVSGPVRLGGVEVSRGVVVGPVFLDSVVAPGTVRRDPWSRNPGVGTEVGRGSGSGPSGGGAST